jgi:L-ascorbate metabolism protein UlaG (beta-lactamase superfamily)
MKITYLGQAGLLFEKNGFKIMIDPYYKSSDYIEETRESSIFKDVG